MNAPEYVISRQINHWCGIQSPDPTTSCRLPKTRKWTTSVYEIIAWSLCIDMYMMSGTWMALGLYCTSSVRPASICWKLETRRLSSVTATYFVTVQPSVICFHNYRYIIWWCILLHLAMLYVMCCVVFSLLRHHQRIWRSNTLGRIYLYICL